MQFVLRIKPHPAKSKMTNDQRTYSNSAWAQGVGLASRATGILKADRSLYMRAKQERKAAAFTSKTLSLAPATVDIALAISSTGDSLRSTTLAFPGMCSEIANTSAKCADLNSSTRPCCRRSSVVSRNLRGPFECPAKASLSDSA